MMLLLRLFWEFFKTGLFAIVFGGKVDDFGAFQTALHGAVFKDAFADDLVLVFFGFVAPEDAVGVFVFV